MPILIGEQDVAFWNAKNTEFYKNYTFPVEVSVLKNDIFDQVYGEDQNKRYAEPYKIEAYIPNLPDWKNEATRFGADETRPLTIMFGLDLISQLKIDLPKIGDRVKIQNDNYQIMQTNPLNYRSNIQIPMTHICNLVRVRPETVPEGTTVYKNY